MGPKTTDCSSSTAGTGVKVKMDTEVKRAGGLTDTGVKTSVTVRIHRSILSDLIPSYLSLILYTLSHQIRYFIKFQSWNS